MQVAFAENGLAEVGAAERGRPVLVHYLEKDRIPQIAALETGPAEVHPDEGRTTQVQTRGVDSPLRLEAFRYVRPRTELPGKHVGASRRGDKTRCKTQSYQDVPRVRHG